MHRRGRHRALRRLRPFSVRPATVEGVSDRQRVKVYQHGRKLAYLVGAAASDATEGRLSGTDGGVDVGLESGGFLVRHDCWFVGL